MQTDREGKRNKRNSIRKKKLEYEVICANDADSYVRYVTQCVRHSIRGLYDRDRGRTVKRVY